MLFYHGKREKPSRGAKRRSLVLLLSLVLILTAAVGGTLAFLIADSGPVTNTFTPGEVETTIEETVSGDTKSDVKVKNTGSVDAYIRAAIVINWVDGSGNVLAAAPVAGTDYTLTMGTSGWTKGSDGYWYYAQPVAANGSTAELIDTCAVNRVIDGADHLEVTVLAQAIQADPAEAVKEAWDVTVADNGTISAN